MTIWKPSIGTCTTPWSATGAASELPRSGRRRSRGSQPRGAADGWPSGDAGGEAVQHGMHVPWPLRICEFMGFNSDSWWLMMVNIEQYWLIMIVIFCGFTFCWFRILCVMGGDIFFQRLRCFWRLVLIVGRRRFFFECDMHHHRYLLNSSIIWLYNLDYVFFSKHVKKHNVFEHHDDALTSQVPTLVSRRGDSKAWEERGRGDRGLQGRWHHRALEQWKRAGDGLASFET